MSQNSRFVRNHTTFKQSFPGDFIENPIAFSLENSLLWIIVIPLKEFDQTTLRPFETARRRPIEVGCLSLTLCRRQRGASGNIGHRDRQRRGSRCVGFVRTAVCTVHACDLKPCCVASRWEAGCITHVRDR